MKKVFVWILGLLPVIGSFTVVNRVKPYVFGLPFIVFWAAAWLVLTSVCLYVMSIIQDRQEEGKLDE
ncbi:DUF3311 domain-containing protein [Bacillus cytotoxicus]|uniref:YhjC n=1 Tax=Bacillus cytotoxicus (strain DSM 22905 / CIP 110041 / 391-98 / NVH 391-98) TaxID=315749 RepID=A7GLU8_BACCN|nr:MULTISPECIES: DUF3311 domain-containing protein [Bacillus cereus group]ABS21106.1 YhjC [Bacillus cytotoxicus NVH 391-98]AWC27760.1 DUF3311 domain-containing protein [Bacillus cytotoxicus]AWC40861.1 DUF3311 domain-containing protein [Bacillus cytotoxicus]AWC43835.1 DUF3311 domain-containing protein [Bacillus cytotoxicus]AWC48792.1 DUF3311 domain-containing protein [Bacillus cytotoxicus]